MVKTAEASTAGRDFQSLPHRTPGADGILRRAHRGLRAEERRNQDRLLGFEFRPTHRGHQDREPVRLNRPLVSRKPKSPTRANEARMGHPQLVGWATRPVRYLEEGRLDHSALLLLMEAQRAKV